MDPSDVTVMDYYWRCDECSMVSVKFIDYEEMVSSHRAHMNAHLASKPMPGFIPWRTVVGPISMEKQTEVLGPDVKCKRCETVAPRHIGPGCDYNGCHDIGLVPNVEGWTVAVVWTNAEGVAMPKAYLCPACAPALLRSKADEAKERDAKQAAFDTGMGAVIDKILAKELVLMRESLESGPGIDKTRDLMHETYVLDVDLLCDDA